MKRSNSHNSVYRRIYAEVCRIPYGSVASYGQIAAQLDRCTPRMVGYAMARVPFGQDIPWHRVINSKGMISLRVDGKPCEEQRYLLEAEGIQFNKKGIVIRK